MNSIHGFGNLKVKKAAYLSNMYRKSELTCTIDINSTETKMKTFKPFKKQDITGAIQYANIHYKSSHVYPNNNREGCTIFTMDSLLLEYSCAVTLRDQLLNFSEYYFLIVATATAASRDKWDILCTRMAGYSNVMSGHNEQRIEWYV
jgi:hypothetical protein